MIFIECDGKMKKIKEVGEIMVESKNEKLLEDKKTIDKIFESINIKSDVGEFKFKRIKTKNQNLNSASPIIIEFESITQKFKVLKAAKQQGL